MSVLKVITDSNGALQITYPYNKSNYIIGDDEIIQNINTKLGEWKNDCFFNVDAGIYWQIRMGSPNQLQLLIADITTVIKSVPGVSQINSVNVLEESKSPLIYTIKYSINTVYSNQEIQGNSSVIY